VLARLSVWDFFEPSKTILLGYKSRSPCAFDFIENKINAPKKVRKKYLERGLFTRVSVITEFFTIGFFKSSKKSPDSPGRFFDGRIV
jgi:hypothetical protein